MHPCPNFFEMCSKLTCILESILQFQDLMCIHWNSGYASERSVAIISMKKHVEKKCENDKIINALTSSAMPKGLKEQRRQLKYMMTELFPWLRKIVSQPLTRSRVLLRCITVKAYKRWLYNYKL